MVRVLARRVIPAELMAEYRMGFSWAAMAAKRNCGTRDVKRIVHDRLKAVDIDERQCFLLIRMMKNGDC